MRRNDTSAYHLLLESLAELMTVQDGFDIPKIFSVMTELCKLLRVSKGVTSFYESLDREAHREGEDFVCYDSGGPHRLVSFLRMVTPSQMVVTCSVYQEEGEPPLTNEERQRVELIQRMILTFLNRSRQEQIINRLLFWDADGYRNLRFWLSETARRIREGRIAGTAALRINLKHFSLVNRQVGRETGNKVMAAYIRRLEETLGNDGFLCRIDGDNFAAFCSQEALPELLHLLRGHPVSYDRETGQRIEVSAVAGVLSIEDGMDLAKPEDIMDKITSAYNVAKRLQRDDIIFYSRELQQEKEKIIQTLQTFDRALENQEFLVYYQPKVDIQSHEIIGAEALCRWMHNGALIPPGDFIPTLEQSMDICRLDFYMLDKVCRDLRRWLDQGRNVVRVSVNLSRRHMMDPDLFDHLVEIIDSHNVPHKYLEIELTETTTDVEFQYLKRIVSGLQAAGIQTSVDDFGVGYSSLNLIKEIPWNVLKLDKSILPAEGSSETRDSRLFAHVVAMAHEIGLTCVAEGVETREQMEILRQFGCRIAQGFLFDMPMPVEAFEKRMAAPCYQQDHLNRETPWGAQAVEDPFAKITSADIAQALASDYFSIYCVDMETESFLEFSASNAYRTLGIETRGKDFFQLSRDNALRSIDPRDHAFFLDTFRKENILASLQAGHPFTMTYRLLFQGRPTYVQMKATSIDQTDLRHLVIGVSNVDEQMKHREAMERIKEARVTYNRISALSGDLLAIYTVDPVTDDYTEYSAAEDYAGLHLEKTGTDFFRRARDGSLHALFSEDVDLFASAFTRENVFQEIEADGLFTLTYRLMLRGEPTYVNLKAARVEEKDGPQLIVGLVNINAQVRREQDYERKLAAARSRANIDALTGVRNKHAYVDLEAQIDREIQAGTSDPFALVIFDVNGLKDVNDTLGHQAGDKFLQDACSEICRLFKHSPVFRIGGDEFVAVARGQDYEDLDALIETLDRNNQERLTAGGIVIARGMARFNGYHSVGALFEDADRRMYENKRDLKGPTE